jgi:hypothetical protein
MRRGGVLSTLMLVVLLHASPAWATAFTFESSFDPAANRLDVSVDVVDVADILPGTFGVLSFAFDIAFNPLIFAGDPLLSVNVSAGTFLDPASSFIAALGDPISGSLTILSLLLGPVPTGATADGRLATVSFLNINPGIDPSVLISNVQLTTLIDPTTEPPLVGLVALQEEERTSVPEPSALALVAIGLLAMRRGLRKTA